MQGPTNVNVRIGAGGGGAGKDGELKNFKDFLPSQYTADSF